MRLGVIGGTLVVVGAVMFVASEVLLIGGNVVDMDLNGVSGLITPASMTLLAIGVLVLGVTGPGQLHPRLTRTGLTIFAVGLLSLVAAGIVGAGLTYDPLENGPFVILALVGALCVVAGSLLTVLALVRVAGLTRNLGLSFLGAIVLAILAGMVNSNIGGAGLPFVLIGPALLVGSATLVGVAVIGLGVLAIRGDETGAIASV